MLKANKLTLILWMLFPLLATAQVLPPITRNVLTTNIPAFGSAGQALFRIAVPPYLNWSNVVASGGLSISDSNNIINLASNYTYAVSNYSYTASNALSGQITTASNSVLNAGSNYTFAVSNLVVASTNGQFIEKTGGIGTNTTFYQANQTGPAITIGTNQLPARAVFSIMGVTNGPSQYLVQIGNPMGTASVGQTNLFIISTNNCVSIGATPDANYMLKVNNVIDASAYSIASGNTLAASVNGNIRLGTAFRPTNYFHIGYSYVTNAMIAVSNTTTPVISFLNSSWTTNSQQGNQIAVGIGTNAPQATLHVNGGATTNENAILVGTTNNYGLLSLTTNGVLTVKSNVVAQGGLISTNDFVYQRDQTGSALTIGTNAGAVFSIMGVTNGPSPYTIQVGNATTGTTNDFLLGTNRNAYFGGKLGIGTLSSSYSLDVTAPVAIAAREPIIRASTSDGGNSAFFVYNGTSSDGFFQPTFGGLYDSGATRPSLGFFGFIKAANDSSGNQAVIRFTTANTSSSTDPINGTLTGVTNRLLYAFDSTTSSGGAVDEVVIDPKGMVGIGTNLPQSRLHIQNYGNSTNQYLLIAGQSNNPTLLTLDTNGVLTVKSNVFIGTQMLAQQPIGLYGSMMMNATNMNAYGAAYTNVSGYNVAITNGFFANLTTGDITNTVAGYYRCTISISFAGQNAHLYEGCLLTNGVDPETIAWRGQFDTPARMRSQTGTGIIYLPAGTRCHFAIKDESGAGDVAINRASIVIGTP